MYSQPVSKQKKGRSRSVIIWLCIAVVVIGLGIAGRLVAQAAGESYRHIQMVRIQAEQLAMQARAGEWEASVQSAESLHDSIPQLQQTLDAASVVQWVPGVRGYIRDANGLLAEGELLLTEYQAAAGIMAGLQNELDGSLTNPQTREAVVVAGAQLEGHALRALTAARRALAIWEESPWQRHVYVETDQMRDTLAAGERQLAAARLAYALLASPLERDYLILIQNNTELRPTGGFIGNYGVATVQRGEIKRLFVDDIYALDRPAEGRLDIMPPEPLQQYFNRSQWMLRDINWSPDFPTTAQKAVTMYALEGGEESIDGVIAITPAVINDLFAVLGPVEFEGVTYDAHNFVDVLQYEVEKGFVDKGRPESERKRAVQVIARTLQERLLALPLADFTRFNNRFVSNFDEKNIQVFSFDERAQGIARAYGWDGALASGTENTLLVVDANLGSFKTDPAVRRRISYHLSAENPTQMEVTIRYQHDGTRDWKTSHYRTYTRVYVPAGSELLSATGAMRDDTQAPGEVDVYEENGRTVFGAFVVTNPGEVQELQFTYRVPQAAVSPSQPQVVVEKQAGNVYTDYLVSLPRTVGALAISPSHGTTQTTTNAVHWEGWLTADTTFRLR